MQPLKNTPQRRDFCWERSEWLHEMHDVDEAKQSSRIAAFSCEKRKREKNSNCLSAKWCSLYSKAFSFSLKKAEYLPKSFWIEQTSPCRWSARVFTLFLSSKCIKYVRKYILRNIFTLVSQYLSVPKFLTSYDLLLEENKRIIRQYYENNPSQHYVFIKKKLNPFKKTLPFKKTEKATYWKIP